MTEQAQPKENKKLFEFPKNTLTYFYFLPNVSDVSFVESSEGGRKYVYATLLIDGFMPLTDGQVKSGEDYQPLDFNLELTRFTPGVWKKLQVALKGHDNFSDPTASVCVALISRQVAGRTSYQPFVATDSDTNKALVTNLVEKCGETTILTAIAEATSLLPMTLMRTNKKRKGGNIPSRTALLNTLLDTANHLDMEQLKELCLIVKTANEGRYKIKLRWRDMWLPHIGQTGV